MNLPQIDTNLNVSLGGESLYLTPVIVDYKNPRLCWYNISDFAPGFLGMGVEFFDTYKYHKNRPFYLFFVRSVNWFKDFGFWLKWHFFRKHWWKGWRSSISNIGSLLRYVFLIERPDRIYYPYTVHKVYNNLRLSVPYLISTNRGYLPYTEKELTMLYTEEVEKMKIDPRFHYWREDGIVDQIQSLLDMKLEGYQELGFICELDT